MRRPMRPSLFPNLRTFLSAVPTPLLTIHPTASLSRQRQSSSSRDNTEERDGRIGARRAFEPRSEAILGGALRTRNRTGVGGSGDMRVLLSVRTRIARSQLQAFTPAGVSAYARHHGTKNRLRSLVLLPPGGGEVVRGRGCEPIEAQPIEEFVIRVTTLVSREWTIAPGAIVQAARLVLGERIRPPRW